MEYPADQLGENLIVHFKNGCEKTFQQVYNHFNLFLFHLAGKLVTDKYIAQDIVIETFMKLWAKHQSFHSVGSIKSFLSICVRNACINHLNAQKIQNRARKEIFFLGREGEDFVSNKIIHEETLKELYTEIENLPPRCKEVVIKTYIVGKKRHEIAAEMKVSENTVRNQGERGKDLLKTRLQLRMFVGN